MIDYQKKLIQIGLDEVQSFIYSTLLKGGEMTARKVQQTGPYKRGLIYKNLEELGQLGLVEKIEKTGKVAKFAAYHPVKLKELAQDKEKAAKDAQLAMDTLLPQLISDYNLSFGAPGVSFYKGLEGLQKVYDDIIDTKKDLMLFRSIYDDKHPERAEIIQKQIQRQVKANLRALIIAPPRGIEPEELSRLDEKNLVTRRTIPQEMFRLESQIIIYGQKVAITSLKDDSVTTLINNTSINQAFRAIFNLIWQISSSRPEWNESPQKPANKKPRV